MVPVIVYYMNANSTIQRMQLVTSTYAEHIDLLRDALIAPDEKGITEAVRLAAIDGQDGARKFMAGDPPSPIVAYMVQVLCDHDDYDLQEEQRAAAYLRVEHKIYFDGNKFFEPGMYDTETLLLYGLDGTITSDGGMSRLTLYDSQAEYENVIGAVLDDPTAKYYVTNPVYGWGPLFYREDRRCTLIDVLEARGELHSSR